MTRLWQFPEANVDPAARGVGGPPPSWETERYATRPARPVAQLAVRVGLWSAVALGCVGGVVSLVRPPAQEVRTVAASDASSGVPGPVARRAEQVVEAWLTATEQDSDRLATLFLEPPSLEGVAVGELRIGEAVAVAARRLQEGYWAVTVEVEVTEPVPVVAGETPSPDVDGTTTTTTWFLEVPIVGQVDGGLVALAAPAVLPAGPDVSTGWRPSFSDPEPPTDDDPTAEAVEGFLDAMLAGAGNPGRYVAPGVAAQPADPPPFADIEVVTLAVDPLSEGEYRVLAEVSALTVGGARQRFSYELLVVERVDRLEITQFSGTPTMVAGSAEPPESAAEPTDAGP